MFGKSGGLSPNAIEIIDILTLDVFECIKCLPNSYNITNSTLNGYLNGNNPNKSNIRYLSDFNNIIKELENKFNRKLVTKEDILELIKYNKEDYLNFWNFYPGKKPKIKGLTDDEIIEKLKIYNTISELRIKDINLYKLANKRVKSIMGKIFKKDFE